MANPMKDKIKDKIKDKDFLEIDPVQLLKALWKRAWIVVLAVIVCGGGVFGYTSWMVEKEYTAKAMIYVNNDDISVGGASISLSSTDIAAAKSLVDTYSVILETHNILSVVSENLHVKYGYDYTWMELRGMIRAAAVDSTEVMGVMATSTDPQKAINIANEAINVLIEEIPKIIKGSSASEVDSAVIAPKSAPNVTRQTMFGMLLGFVLSAIGIIIADIMDQYIRSEEYLLENFANVPILAVIHDLDDRSSKHHTYYYSNSKKRG